MDLGFTETLLSNLFLNASITGWKKQDEYRTKYNCNVPWAILLDPTSACNLHCKGCWAAEYGNKLNLSLSLIHISGLSKIVRCVRFFSSLSLLKASGQSFFAVIPLFIWTLFCKTTGIASFLQFFSFILFVKYTLCPKNTFYSCCIFSSANNLPAPFINGILKLSTV